MRHLIAIVLLFLVAVWCKQSFRVTTANTASIQGVWITYLPSTTGAHVAAIHKTDGQGEACWLQYWPDLTKQKPNCIGVWDGKPFMQTTNQYAWPLLPWHHFEE